jgi:hypothetical protein
MTRIRQSERKRELVHLEQEGYCILCDYPLLLGCHLHHVIASDDQGPDHPLNLVGLCPNHHTVLECVRRHVAPKEVHGNASWLQRAQAALTIIEALPEERRSLFNELSEPHPLRKEIREGVEVRFRTALAVDIAMKDARLLLTVNKARPRILLLWRIKRGIAPMPKTDTEWLEAIIEARETVRADDIVEVVVQHLSSLGLPFEPSWLEEPNSSTRHEVVFPTLLTYDY